MMDNNFSIICEHPRLTRIDDNFVRCLKCGESMISQKNMSNNKSNRDFLKENKSAFKNFDRNFSNVLEAAGEKSQPIYEYYTDRSQANSIVINRQVQFCSDPAKYEVFVNGAKNYFTNDQIQRILQDTSAIRIDQSLAEKIKRNKQQQSRNYWKNRDD